MMKFFVVVAKGIVALQSVGEVAELQLQFDLIARRVSSSQLIFRLHLQLFIQLSW